MTSTKQQLSNYGIGASEISTCAGLNPFSSPWDLWLVKTGQREPFAGNEATDWGHRLEPAIRQKYVDDTGAIVYVPKESIFSKETPWARATPDGIALEPFGNGNKREDWTHLVQCKNVSYWVGREWNEAPPTYVQLQEQWELYVTGLQRADVAALIGGSDFRIYTVHRDDKAIADLLTIASDFWRRCEQRIPPEIDNSDACREHFEKRLKRENTVELVADADLNKTMEQWQEYVRALKAAQKGVDTVRNVIRSHMAEAQADRIVSDFGVAKLDASKKLLSPREWAKGE